jgi:hypothetical protein
LPHLYKVSRDWAGEGTSYSYIFPVNRGLKTKKLKKSNDFASRVYMSGERLTDLQGPFLIKELRVRGWACWNRQDFTTSYPSWLKGALRLLSCGTKHLSGEQALYSLVISGS